MTSFLKISQIFVVEKRKKFNLTPILRQRGNMINRKSDDFKAGLAIGLAEGLRLGHKKGYAEGYDAGYDAGYDDVREQS